MIKQFNFYDIYGYLLPGTVLAGLLWLPLGILTGVWPEQDLSKAVFLAAIAYIAGHIVQTIANSVVPSTVRENNQARFPSELFLDKNNLKFSGDFKTRLSSQVSKLFGLDLMVNVDGDGKNDASRNRQTAFFQARSFLIAMKSAHYVEQFEGLYAMMRGLACSFLAGTLYLAGWGLAFHQNLSWLRALLAILLAVSMAGALLTSLIALSRGAHIDKAAVAWLAVCLLLALLGLGFWIGASQPSGFWSRIPSHSEWMLWTGVCLACIAAARCFSAYKSFAEQFAQSVWRDFSAYLSFQKTAPVSHGDASDDD